MGKEWEGGLDLNMHVHEEPLNTHPAIWSTMQDQRRLRLHTLSGVVELSPTWSSGW